MLSSSFPGDLAYCSVVLIYFLAIVTNVSVKNNLKKEGFVLASAQDDIVYHGGEDRGHG